jgi:uncharacterized C2H2 Zn-finger protein
MSFTCVKCEKEFTRELSYTRHINRKTTCYKNLACVRCNKIFKTSGNLKRHYNRKNPCEDKRSVLDIKLKIAQEYTTQENAKITQENVKLSQEKERTKQAHLNVGKVINYNIQNIFGDQINYINNIGDIDVVTPSCKWDAQQLIETNNVEATLGNFIKHIFYNDDYPKNKCLKHHEGEVYSKHNDRVVEFKNAKLAFINKIKGMVMGIDQEYGQLSEDEIYQFGLSQRMDYIPDYEINTIKKTELFVANNRNNRHVENVIIKNI